MCKYIIVVLLVLCGCTFRWADKEISFFQMQVREGSASIYSTKLYGTDIEFPIPLPNGVGQMKFIIGYLGETKGIIPTKEDGELPDVCIDITQEKDSFSDTYSTGTVSRQLYPSGTVDKEVVK